MPTVAVGIRFEREFWARLSAAAQLRGLSPGAYIRQLLEEREQVASALADLQASFEGRAAEGSGPQASLGTTLEMLLLLRQVAGPERARIAQAEVGRLGLAVWKPR